LKARQWIGTVALTAYLAVIVVPLVWVLISSLKTSPEIFASPWSLPAQPKFENYAAAWNEAGLAKYFWNSVLVTVGSLAALIPIGAMASYIFARYPFRGSKLLYVIFLGGMMFPNFLVLAPLTDLLRRLGLTESLVGLGIVYVAFSLSFTVFVLTGFFQSVPTELEEAAVLDGCGHLMVYRKIMLPLARPGLIVAAIFNGLGLWNEFNLALVLANSESIRTLPIGLANLTMARQYQADWGSVFAALVIVMLPAFVVYWRYRERIYEAMLAGAVKG